MRWTISLLVAISALVAAPSASGMGLRTVTVGHATPAVRSETRSAPRRHAPRHRFTLLDESAGTAVRARPGGRVLGTLAGRTPLGTPTWLWAVAFSRNDGWARARCEQAYCALLGAEIFGDPGLNAAAEVAFREARDAVRGGLAI